MTWALPTKPPPSQFIIDRAASINQGLVFWGGFNEGGGTTLHDYSGYGNHGTLTGMDPATGWVTTPRGGGLDFDGVDDYVNIGNPSIIDLTTSHTVSLWVKATTVNAFNTLVSQDQPTNEYLLLVDGGTSNRVRLITNGVNALVAANDTFVINTWYHIVVTVDSSNMGVIYQNGVVMNSATITPSDVKTNDIWFGMRDNVGGDIPWTGPLDDARIYNRALTAQEIQQLYQNPYAGIWTPTRTYFVPAAPVGGASPTAGIYGPLVGPLGGPV